jgi:dTDP-4-amino-4,6-dideoxygalactose transaminase
MSDVAAAVGRAQLRKLPAYTRARRRNAHRLDAALRGVRIPPAAAGHVYHQYTIRVSDRPVGREAVLNALHERGIGAAVYYPTPVHRLPAYRTPTDLPDTEAAAGQVLSLPVHPALTDTDLDRIAQAVNTLTARTELVS